MGVRWEFEPRSEPEDRRRQDKSGLGLLGIGHTWSGDGVEGGGSEMRWWRIYYKNK
jgi:hypothetical protein